jgi:hypothetical protein
VGLAYLLLEFERCIFSCDPQQWRISRSGHRLGYH